MRINHLELQAVGPFPSKHVIDFDQLGESALFLIDGPTGAGKSTGLKMLGAAANAEMIFDTNMNSFSSSVAKIEQVMQAHPEITGWGLLGGWPLFTVVVAAGLVLVALVVFVEQAQRRIPVQYAKRMVGRRMYGGTSTYIPLKVNMAGVIPVIFASSLLYLPAMMAQFNNDPNNRWATWIQDYLVRGDHPLYVLTFYLLIIFFTYFYTAVVLNKSIVSVKVHVAFQSVTLLNCAVVFHNVSSAVVYVVPKSNTC